MRANNVIHSMKERSFNLQNYRKLKALTGEISQDYQDMILNKILLCKLPD